MNGALNKEIQKNKQDKIVSEGELENQKKIFADNLRQHNRNEILFENKPLPLKKPFKVKWREFINKLKIVFGA